MSCHKGVWNSNEFILLYFIILGGAVRAGGHSQLWAEPKAKGTRSTNPTEAEKGEQEEEIVCVCVLTDSECEREGNTKGAAGTLCKDSAVDLLLI